MTATRRYWHSVRREGYQGRLEPTLCFIDDERKKPTETKPLFPFPPTNETIIHDRSRFNEIIYLQPKTPNWTQRPQFLNLVYHSRYQKPFFLLAAGNLFFLCFGWDSFFGWLDILCCFDFFYFDSLWLLEWARFCSLGYLASYHWRKLVQLNAI